jgi:hypothetical protein
MLESNKKRRGKAWFVRRRARKTGAVLLDLWVGDRQAAEAAGHSWFRLGRNVVKLPAGQAGTKLSAPLVAERSRLCPRRWAGMLSRLFLGADR